MVKPGGNRPLKVDSQSYEIDIIIKRSSDWQGKMLSMLRSIIKSADPDVLEEVKWKKPSNPLGVPVWSHNGIICFGNNLKNAVRLTFPRGAKINDSAGLFNTRLESKTVRAIDFPEKDAIDKDSLTTLILEAIELNTSEVRT